MKKDEKNVSAAPLADLEYSLLMNSFGASVSKHLLDEHYTVVWANDRYYDMFGYTKEEYETLFHNQCDLYYQNDPQDWQDMVDYITKALSGDATRYEYVCRMRHRSGKKLWIKLIGTLTGEVQGGYPISYSVMMDITEQMQLQVEQTVTYNHFPGLIAKYKAAENGLEFIDANRKYFHYLPKHENFALGDLTAENGLAEVAALYPAIRRGESVSLTVSPLSRDGRRLYLRVTAECVDWENGDPIYLLIYDDITKLTEQQALLRQSNAELERLAFEDPVTGGMNRTRFDMVAGDAIRSAPAGSYALVWLNMQKFKLINDAAGNKEGDATLKYAYDILGKQLEEGEYAARISADNYTLLLKNSEDGAMIERLDEMIKAVNLFNEGRKDKYFLSFTAGIYRIDDPSLEITQIQDRAHVARKKIRKTDADSLCSCRFYSDQDRKKLMAEKEVENKMRAALERGEFEIYLQPKVSLEENNVAGAEALVRWNDPEKGLVPPGDFIPVFEKTGFIIQLDLYVMEKVCALLRSWIDRGLVPVPISVNVSRAHFTLPDFTGRYAELCAKYEIPPELIEIEVTETVVFEDPEAFSKIVARIHERGFTCSMDDFGSGYSSLNVLKDIEVDTLKLDRAFFKSEQMDNPRERHVVSAVIGLAKSLEMGSVAEGVETRAQTEFLRNAQCDMVQGFVYSRPVPADVFERRLLGKTME